MGGLNYAFGGDTPADTAIGILLMLLSIVGIVLFLHGLDMVTDLNPATLGVGSLATFAGAALTKIGMTTGY